MASRLLSEITFGTDGIRGKFGTFPIDKKTLCYIAQALTSWLIKHHNIRYPVIAIGRDTRYSGISILQALIEGVQYQQGEIIDIGILPTPAIPYYCGIVKAHLGIVITASHNPAEYNGIKLFNGGMGKFSLVDEQSIQGYIASFQPLAEWQGQYQPYRNEHQLAKAAYVQKMQQQFQQLSDMEVLRKPLKIVVDLANGATYEVAKLVLTKLNAKLISIADYPDGKNINDKCGATYSGLICQQVIEHQADLGVTFDGDGDRILLADRKGKLINGDGILLLLSKEFASHKQGVVGTLMTNLYVEQYCQRQSIPFLRTKVGDKYITEELNNRQWLLGSEPSGHILLPKLSVTGDALLTLMVILAILDSKNLDLAEENFESYPQKLINFRTNNSNLINNKGFQQALQKLKKRYHNKARILVRSSGTEPIIRIMCESDSPSLNDNVCQQLQDYLKKLNSNAPY